MDKNFEEMSRLNWQLARDPDADVERQVIAIGCLQRIANSLEEIHKHLKDQTPEGRAAKQEQDTWNREFLDRLARTKFLDSQIGPAFPKGPGPIPGVARKSFIWLLEAIYDTQGIDPTTLDGDQFATAARGFRNYGDQRSHNLGQWWGKNRDQFKAVFAQLIKKESDPKEKMK